MTGLIYESDATEFCDEYQMLVDRLAGKGARDDDQIGVKTTGKKDGNEKPEDRYEIRLSGSAVRD